MRYQFHKRIEVPVSLEIKRQFRTFRLTAFGWGCPTVYPSFHFEVLATQCGDQMEMFPDL